MKKQTVLNCRPGAVALGFLAGLALSFSVSAGNSGVRVALNPYERVDWDTFERHKAALHVHTLQSDGHHMLEEVTRSYKEAGFTILAITDHDIFEPNAQIRWGNVAEDAGTHLPQEPKPDNYPANTTWPWTDFESPSPQTLGLLGIEAAELTSKHHMNSFFNDFGVRPDEDLSEDEQLLAVKERSGVAFLDHPGIAANWWTRRPVEWYIERFETHSPDYLAGIEVTNAPEDRIQYDVGLWDQLLARLMPSRPVWGFGTDDMHNLAGVRESDSVFLLEELNEDAARQAMRDGQFYFRWSSRRIDLREGRGPFPSIQRIVVDNDAGLITIRGAGYDTIKWISTPDSLEMAEDYKTSNQPWPLGKVVHEGPTLDFRRTPGVEIYVRAELHKTEGDHIFRVFTNPFGLE